MDSVERMVDGVNRLFAMRAQRAKVHHAVELLERARAFGDEGNLAAAEVYERRAQSILKAVRDFTRMLRARERRAS